MKCVYVDELNGSDQNDGLSPETAKCTMAAALREIEVIPLEDTITVTLHGSDVTFGHTVIMGMGGGRENEDETRRET